MITEPRHSRAERGAALATALIFLIVLTLLGVAAVRSSTTALKLAGNEQSRIEAAEHAQAIVDEIADDPDNLQVLPGTSYSACFTSPTSPGGATPDFSCPISTPGLINTSYSYYAYGRVRRIEPEVMPIRGYMNTSGAHFTGAQFEITGGWERRAEGFGAAEITQGVVRLDPRTAGLTTDRQ